MDLCEYSVQQERDGPSQQMILLVVLFTHQFRELTGMLLWSDGSECLRRSTPVKITLNEGLSTETLTLKSLSALWSFTCNSISNYG